MPVSALLVDSDIKVRKFAHLRVLKTIMRVIYIPNTTAILVISWKWKPSSLRTLPYLSFTSTIHHKVTWSPS